MSTATQMLPIMYWQASGFNYVERKMRLMCRKSQSLELQIKCEECLLSGFAVGLWSWPVLTTAAGWGKVARHRPIEKDILRKLRRKLEALHKVP